MAESSKKLIVGSTYSIKFLMGPIVVMTLKSIHEATKSYDVKYTFVDKSGSKVNLTKGVCKRIRIIMRIPNDDLYY